MGLFSQFFKRQERPVITTTIDLLPSILENNLTVKRKELEMTVAKNISELKYLYEKSKSLLKDIKEKELEEKNNERLNKAANTSKNQMEKQLEKMLVKINPNLEKNELENIYSYSKESFIFLFNEINIYRKSIAYTSIYLKDEMKLLGNNLQEMLNKLQEINNLFDKEHNIFFFEKAKKNILEIQNNKKMIAQKEEEIKMIENDLIKFNKELLSKKNEINDLKNSAGAKEIESLNNRKSDLLNEKQSLKVELSSMISTVDKPLQRFSQLIESGRWRISSEDKDLLDSFLVNPIVALKKDINGKKIKEILNEVLKAIEDEKIELKDKEKEKRIDALMELINFDYFGKIFWKVNEIQKEINEIESKISKNETSKIINKNEQILVQIDLKIKEKNQEIEFLKTQINNINLKINDETKKIQEFSEKVLNKKIIIDE